MNKIVFLLILFILHNTILAQEITALQDTLSMKKDEKKLYIDNIGKKLPVFIFKDYNGNDFSNRNLEEKVSMVFFWHSMCGGCLRSINYLNAIIERFGKGRVNYYALSVGDDKWLLNSTVKNLERKGLKGVDSIFNFLMIPSNKHNLTFLNNPHDITTLQGIKEYYLKDTINYSKNLTREFAKNIGIVSTPTFFLTDKKGIIRYISIGKMNEAKQQEFESILQYLLDNEN